MTFQELGEQIRQKRESKGLSLEALSSRTKVSSRILKAIEEGVQSSLPHAVYTKSFIRSCGRELGFDPDALNATLEQLFPSEKISQLRSDAVRAPKAKAPSYSDTPRRLVFLCVFMLLIGAVSFGGWYVTTNYGDAIVDLVKKPFVGNQDEKPAPPDAAENAGDAGSAAREPAPQSAEPPALPDEPAAPAPAEASAPSDDAAGPTPITVGTGDNRIEVTVLSTCWIRPQIDGARGRDYTLNEGDSFIVAYKGKAELTLSNAGGVSILHNGKKMKTPGAEGQQVTVRFTAK